MYTYTYIYTYIYIYMYTPTHTYVEMKRADGGERIACVCTNRWVRSYMGWLRLVELIKI